MMMDGGMGGGMDGGMLGGGMASEPPPDFSMPTIGPLAEYRMAQENKLAERAAATSAALAEKQAEARVAIEQFYAERTAKSEAKAKTNQEEAAMFVADRDATMLSESWESVCKMIDLTAKENEKEDPKSVARMRSLLFQLKAMPAAAAAAGGLF